MPVCPVDGDYPSPTPAARLKVHAQYRAVDFDCVHGWAMPGVFVVCAERLRVVRIHGLEHVLMYISGYVFGLFSVSQTIVIGDPGNVLGDQSGNLSNSG